MNDIGKELYPNSGILQENGTATIVDEELDLINCDFNGDNCAVLNVKDYSYITLSDETLDELMDLIIESKTNE